MVAKWILTEDDSARARHFYRACIQANEQLVAPHLLASEVTNILKQRMRRGQHPLTLAEAMDLLRQFLRLPVELPAPLGLYESALALADSENLPAAHDANYLALAQLTGSRFWTADERLFRAVTHRLPFVHWIGEYRGALSE